MAEWQPQPVVSPCSMLLARKKLRCRHRPDDEDAKAKERGRALLASKRRSHRPDGADAFEEALSPGSPEPWSRQVSLGTWEAEAQHPEKRKGLRSLSSYHLTRSVGSIFRPSTSRSRTTMTRQTSDYDKSEACETIDDFVSHSWATSWFKKGVSLCYIYNRKFALRTATVAALVLLGLGRIVRRRGLMDGEVVLLIGTWVPVAIFFIFLFFGQEFFPHLRRSTFFDKACICQDDDKKKQEGIDNLGTFLSSSSRFIMLWNEDYFKSLWCSWEAAIFLKLSKSSPGKSIEITPMFLMLLNIFGFGASSGFVILGDVFRNSGALNGLLKTYESSPDSFEYLACLFLNAFGFFADIGFNVFLSQFVAGIAAIEGQLKNFRWKQARCALEADSEKLGRQVLELHGSIEAFEEYLATQFLEDCKQQLGGSLFPYNTVVSICFPLFCAGLARLSLVEDFSTALFVALSYGLISFVGCPLSIWSNYKTWEFLVPRLGARLSQHRLTLSVLLAVPFSCVCITVIFFGLRFLSLSIVWRLDPSFVRPATFTPFLDAI